MQCNLTLYSLRELLATLMTLCRAHVGYSLNSAEWLGRTFETASKPLGNLNVYDNAIAANLDAPDIHFTTVSP